MNSGIILVPMNAPCTSSLSIPHVQLPCDAIQWRVSRWLIATTPYVDFSNTSPELWDVEKTWNEFISGEAPLFFNPRWSSKWIHGSDTVFPIITLAEKILKPWEQIEMLPEIRFSWMISHGICIQVWDIDAPMKAIERGEKACVTGSLKTSHGRILRFRGIENKYNNISETRWHNPLMSLETILPISDNVIWTESYISTMDRDSPMWDQANCSVALRVSTTLELFTILSNLFFQRHIFPGLAPQILTYYPNWHMPEGYFAPRLITKVENLPANFDIKNILVDKNPTTLHLEKHQDKFIPGKWRILRLACSLWSTSETPCLIRCAYGTLPRSPLA